MFDTITRSFRIKRTTADMLAETVARCVEVGYPARMKSTIVEKGIELGCRYYLKKVDKLKRMQ